jgi:predicted extracellular nuclease
MAKGPRTTPDEVWTIFGRWRRRSPTSRRLGVALLLMALLLTILWARTPRPTLPESDPSAAWPLQLLNQELEACAPSAPADARPVRLPLAASDDWVGDVGEVLCLTHPLVVGEVYTRLTRGTVWAAAERPWAGAEPFDRARVGVTLAHPSFATANGLRNGDALLGLYGTLGGDRVLQVAGFELEVRNPRPASPPEVAGSLRIASFNLGNWFLTPGGRSAELPSAAQRAKLLAALTALDADALVLAEVENDAAGAALAALTEGLNAAQRAGGRGSGADYASFVGGRLGSDAIRVAILYRPAVLQLEGWALDRARVHLRPPLAAHFTPIAGGAPFTLIAAHHRSKGGCPSAGDVDRGSGCWDLQRDAQSQALLDFASTLGAEGWPPALVMGDLNAYRHEAPIARFAAAGWWLAVDQMPAEAAYSYVHFGLAGALDHAAADPALAPRLGGAGFWAINADEARGADARSPTPYRSSDHDPLLLALD